MQSAQHDFQRFILMHQTIQLPADFSKILAQSPLQDNPHPRQTGIIASFDRLRLRALNECDDSERPTVCGEQDRKRLDLTAGTAICYIRNAGNPANLREFSDLFSESLPLAKSMLSDDPSAAAFRALPLRPMVWGGRALHAAFLDGKPAHRRRPTAESWEVSDHPLHNSRLATASGFGVTLMRRADAGATERNCSAPLPIVTTSSPG